MTIRPDQVAGLETTQEKLVDIFLGEADPAGWPAQSEDDGKARFWQKRNAGQTMTLITKIAHMLNIMRGRQPVGGEGTIEGEGDEKPESGVSMKELATAEKQAKALLKKYRSGQTGGTGK